MSRGILYIASGEEFVREANLSAKSVKKHMTDLPITIISDVDVDEVFADEHVDVAFDDTDQITDPVFEFGDPVMNMHRLPYDKTIYIDSDIYFDEPIDDVFELLDAFDIAAAHDPYWAAPEHLDDKLLYGVPQSFPQYNGGVLAMNNSPVVQDFISDWKERYENEVAQDPPHQNQPTLRKALYESELRIATLPAKYNCRIHVPGYAVGDISVFHGRLRSFDTPGVSHSYDMNQVVDELNGSKQPRVWVQQPGLNLKSLERHSFYSIGYLFFRSLVNDGFRKTISNCVEFVKYKLDIDN